MYCNSCQMDKATYYFRYKIFNDQEWHWVGVLACNLRLAEAKARRAITRKHNTLDYLILTGDKQVVIY